MKNVFKKMMNGILSFAMVASLMVVTGTVSEVNAADNGSLVLNKTATLENDGTYTINLEAYATGTTQTIIKQEPTDIVLVLDVSGSMKETLEGAYVEDGYVPAEGRVNDKPTDVFHHCEDGTFSTVTWKDERKFGTGHIRFTCEHCNVTRSLNYTLGIASPNDIEEQDGWSLYKKSGHNPYRMEALQSAANSFVNAVAEKNAAILNTEDQHRIALVKFASEKNNTVGNNINGSGYNYTQIVNNLGVVNDSYANTLKTNINNFSPAGATSIDYGMEHAKSILDSQSNAERKKVVIVFTDGSPTHSNSFEVNVANDAISTAKTLKANGTTVYTIGIFDGADATDITSKNENKYMNALSSNYPNATTYTNLGSGSNAGYYKTFTNVNELYNIFTEISQSIGSTTTTLGSASVTKDIMGEGFDLTNATATAKAFNYLGNNQFQTTGTTLDAVINKTEQSVSVTGFDYAEQYVATVGRNPHGQKLVITIKGVVATDEAVKNALVNTNSNMSGIYENSTSVNPVAVFTSPKTQINSKLFVVDYAKTFNLEGLTTSVDHIGTGMNKFVTATKEVQLTYGNATTSTYTPTNMNWDGIDSFYAFGKYTTTPAGVTTGDNAWTKVSVLPANNVYYEDDFTTENGATVGIEYTGTWTTVGTASGNTETPNNDVYGWVESLADDTTDSDGSSHVSSTKGDTATFTFTGTGVDVYSRTDMSTGKVSAMLYSNTDGKLVAMKGITVDTLAQTDNTWYQVPTLSFQELEHGTYTVKVIVSSTTAVTNTTRSTYYLDGIRVYNPLSEEQEEGKVVIDAYNDEIAASFLEVRDILLDAASLDSTEGQINGVVFLDTNASEVSVGEYESKGPKNEVYLANRQGVAFGVTDSSNIQVGLKALAGEGTTVKFTYGDGTTKEVSIGHSTDLYYKINPTSDGMVMIENIGDNLLSITKLKTAGDIAEVDTASLLSYARSFNSLSVYEDVQEPVEDNENVEIEQPTTPQTQSFWAKLISGIKKLFGK